MTRFRRRGRRVRSLAENLVRFERGSPETAEAPRVAIVAHWSTDARVTKSVCTLVREMQSFGYRVVVASACEDERPLAWNEEVDLRDFVVIRKPNVGYDFGSWSLALAVLPDVSMVERVILANDSMVGPFTSLAPLLSQFEATTADVWGLTDTHQFAPHIQSYFIGFRDGVLADRPLGHFWSDIRDEPDKMRIILRNEVGLGRLLYDEGYVQQPAYHHELYVTPGENPVIRSWRRLLEHGFPFIKREILRDPSVAPDGPSAPDVLRDRFAVDVREWM